MHAPNLSPFPAAYCCKEPDPASPNARMAVKAESSRGRNFYRFAALSHHCTYGSVYSGSISYCFLVFQKFSFQANEL